MRLEHYPVEKLKHEIVTVVGKHLDLKKYRLFFFGSRVNDRGTERSDIDVGIEGSEPIPTEIWLELQEAFENFPILYKIELVDFKNVSVDIKRVARQQIEPIFPPKS